MKHIFLAVVFCCGCGAAVSSTTTTSAEFGDYGDQVAQEQAIQDVSSVRCTRELSCGNIGESGMAACQRDAREATRAILIGRSCSLVPSRQLSACLETIRNAPCGTAETLTDRLASCGGVDLCR